MTQNVGDADLKMQMLEGFHLYPLMVDLRFHRWDDILSAPEPKPERRLLRAFRHYARAMAFAGQGKLAEASAERKQFESLRKALPPESQFLINNKASTILTLAAATLDAELAWASGDKARAVQEWRRAVKLESNVHYDEPPAWFYPVRQSLAAALLRAGRPKEAESVFRSVIGKQPRDGRLLFGLWQSLAAQKRAGEAALVERQFNAAWKDATVVLRVEDL
jgi:predicted Zn-dependent protease